MSHRRKPAIAFTTRRADAKGARDSEATDIRIGQDRRRPEAFHVVSLDVQPQTHRVASEAVARQPGSDRVARHAAACCQRRSRNALAGEVAPL